MKFVAAAAVVATGLVTLPANSFAQSNDDSFRRLEAKLDALAKENAALRERVKRIESPQRVSSTGPGVAGQKQQPEIVTFAANLPVYKAPPPARPSCGQFGGFYVGGHVGWTGHDATWVDRDAWVDNFGTDWALGTVETTKSGIGGGVQGGYNWQRGCTVFGVEVDGSWADLESSKRYSPSSTAGSTALTLDHKVNWYGTLRTRTGVVVDNLLLYATGGLAVADINHSWTVTDVGSVPSIETFSSSKSRWGGVAGVGAEWAITDRWSVKSEALYIRFAEKTTSGFSPNGPDPVAFDTKDALWIARFGANYKLGGP